MPRSKASDQLEPRIVDMPDQRMAVVRTTGDPNTVASQAVGALFGAVYTLKFDLKKKQGVDFKVGALRARWPNAGQAPKEEWLALWGLPIPADTESLPQKVPGVEVKAETWGYGTVAQILHVGPYSEEMPTIQRLHEFIRASGYEVSGPHEEEYLTRPEAKLQKTIIRYTVRRQVQA